jgi:rRNA processing protein Krr1/Pno1
MKWEIKWKSGRIITDAETVEDAIEKFKELGIEVEDKEISISKFGK